ncbi:MAG: bifunctional copper resistance protein CopD/cytochrome c oxidase assembly protein [Promicromonosporaceae bacterium]|nr:bifunctional copper resistance protein CopD/cytochrome c oxidase assembly protein [Promicromonosporaceae bacterium]
MTASTTAPATATTPAPTRPWWFVWAGPIAVVVAIGAALAAGAYTQAFLALGGFSDPGAVVRWGQPVVNVLTNLGAALTLGSLLAAAAFVGPGRLQRTALTTAGVSGAVWGLAGVGGLVLGYADAAATPLDSPGFGSGLWQYVTQIDLGRTGLKIAILAALTSAAALLVRSAVGALWVTVLPLAALAYQASTGHAAGAANHVLATGAMYMHLVGAALWVGGLGAIAVLALAHRRLAARGETAVQRGPDRPVWATAIPRFSVVATWCLLAVGFSGVVSAWIRVGSPSDLWQTRYGWLLVTKAVLLAGLGTLGWLHRRHVIARVHDGRATPGRAFARLAAVELLVMGAVMGVAVALAASAPPVNDNVPLDTSPAYQLTGSALPPYLSGSRWLTEWRLDPLFTFACFAAVVVYLTWVVRLRRRGDAWPVMRAVSWCVGIAVVVWDTNGAPTVYGEVMFSAHMVQHMVLALLVPMLLVLAAPVTLLLRAVPGRRDGSRGPREWVLGFVHSRWGRIVANPLVAGAIFVVGMLVFYFTPLLDWSLRSHVGHVWMVVHFTLAGYLFANSLIGIDPGPQRPPFPARIILLFATMAFHAFFGVALTMQTSLLAASWYGNTGRPWGLTAIQDQQRGGDIAWGIGELPTLALAVAVAVLWARSDEREARRQDRKADRDGDLELEEYNAMLARIAERDR